MQTRARVLGETSRERGRWRPRGGTFGSEIARLGPNDHPEDVLVHFELDYEYVTTPNGKTLLAYWGENDGPRHVIVNWSGGMPRTESVADWIGESLGSDGVSEYVSAADFNAEFWAEAEETTRIYHVTTADRVASILSDSLEMRNETRGIANHDTGLAVFASRERDDSGAYGDAVIEIDVGAMKRDGFLPPVAQEYPVVTEQQQSTLAWILGVEDWEREVHWDGLYEDTVVVFEDIPSRYLRLAD